MPSWQTHMLNGLLRLAVKHRPVKDLKRLRQQVEKLDSRWTKLPGDMRVAEEVIKQLPCSWIRVPASRSQFLILYLHGGAFCLRTPKAHASFLARLCRGTRATGLMPDYRLAPEHPFPAATNDCFKIYRWLISSGYDPKKIIVAGDSAGGGLTFSTLIQIRDAKMPNPAGGVMFSPGTDMTLSGDSFFTNTKKDAMFTLRKLLMFRNAYVQDAPVTHPLVSPLHAAHDNLPPLYFQVSASELLRDSSVLAAQKARAAGVSVELEMVPGMPHCFALLAPNLPESPKAIKNAIGFINALIG